MEKRLSVHEPKRVKLTRINHRHLLRIFTKTWYGKQAFAEAHSEVVRQLAGAVRTDDAAHLRHACMHRAAKKTVVGYATLRLPAWHTWAAPASSVRTVPIEIA